MKGETGRQPEFSWTAQTHQGRVRRNNEDAFLGLMFDNEDLVYLGKEGDAPRQGRQFIFAVSDGMGGAKAGGFASAVVMQTITELISREFHQKRMCKDPDFKQLLFQFFQRVHEGTRRAAGYYEECKGMGATLSLAWFEGENVHVGHIGDSRIYHLPQDRPMQQLTEDHTVAGRLQREGKLSEREAKSHPNKHQLERSIGCHPNPVEPQIMSTSFGDGDHFLLCTDGIIDGLYDQGLEKMVKNPPSYLVELNPAERLIKEGMDASGRDNLTAMVIRSS